MTAAKPKETNKPEMKKVSKRQKIKESLNKSNTWQQQPKIKSMAARDKANIRMAGLGGSKSSSSSKKAPLNPDDDIINSPEFKFGRLLASPLARTRHSTILKLQDYLKARTDPSNEKGGLSILDLMKLWKGLWHTLYLCDGVAVQEEVSKVLSGLIWSVGGTLEEDEYAGRFYLELDENSLDEDMDGDEEYDPMQIIEMTDEDEDDDDDMEEEAKDEDSESGDDDHEGDEQFHDDMNSQDSEDDIENPADDEETKHCRGAHLSALFVRTYFRTLTREWSNMDKYRVDKFYTLTRFVLREIYRYMASRHWNLGIIRLFNDAIFEEVLRVQKYGNGVRFHLLDICVDELALVNCEKETGLPLTEATFLDCMEPFFAMAQRVEDSIVHERVMEKVILRFLEEYSIVSDNYTSDELSKKKLVMDQVHVQTVAQFLFELASDAETEDRYRSQLYDMHKTYMKRVKLVGRDVIMTDGEDEDEDGINNNDDLSDEAGCGLRDDCEKCQHIQNKEGDHEKKDVYSDEKKSKKKKKKKAGGNQEESLQKKVEKTESQLIPNSTDDGALSSQKKKKKKKKKEKKATQNDTSENSNHENGLQKSTEEEDLTITISSDDQKAAAVALKNEEKNASKKRTTKNEPEGKVEKQSKIKRVKFDKVNRSKSYKASINDLKKVDAKATLERTPQRSILMTRKVRK